ncbi:nucleotidyl transferase AbiEii/AbiGii toxin family protein [Aliifodinibius sp. S!AR15-10]|uniref:nucleotidyl transferase AbiEii/AbiGii toxin family protein n=1 Tax=Aliifodinibius sp. S!AR15-10 TaxID=2950437 RepID=UPI002859D277|nr:nucleotidyl transferase AbiEii/AbiGii toxin family protein [Aliifodinibius sp. S!AR15-10]MDR8389519.1 nucleotidyl transferase AbiEii/AbiGii toxin family protein [Aliifodinibius sp. S!AR15-10]
MLPLSEIRPYYSEELHRFPRFMLREYLQYKILEILYESPFATDLCFLGGTCLRIVHGNRRFSEDLDFDNISLEEDAFKEVANEIQKGLEREGYEVELKTMMKGAWHCHIKFPGLLFDEGLSGHQEEKILIQLDTEPQHFDYDPEQFLLNRFEVFSTIWTTPPLLMAQKLYAIINRDRNKGRDFYDLAFLMGRDIKPNYQYLEAKVSISDPESLKEAVLTKCQQLDMEAKAKDVEPFLFDASKALT